MPDLSNAEISVEGDYHFCDVCDLIGIDDDQFDVEPQTGTTSCAFGYGCRTWDTRELDEGDMGHDTALERDTFGDAL